MLFSSAKETLNKLLLFTCTHLVEFGFSTLLHVQTKYRNRFNSLQKTILNMLFHKAAKNSQSC